MGLHVRKPCVHNHGCSRVSRADVTWTIGCFRTRSCDDRDSDWVITTNLGVDRQVYIAGALPWLGYPRPSHLGAVPSSGILSEGDKRDSKGDMPEPPHGSPPLQFSGTEEGTACRGDFAPEPASRTRPRRIHRGAITDWDGPTPRGVGLALFCLSATQNA